MKKPAALQFRHNNRDELVAGYEKGKQCKEVTLHTPTSFDAYVTQDFRLLSTTAPATISVEYEEYSISPLAMVDAALLR